MKTLEELKQEMADALDAYEAAYNAARDVWDVYAVARDTYNETLREKK